MKHYFKLPFVMSIKFLFKIQARVLEPTLILLWHAGLFTRNDLDRNQCTYRLRTFELQVTSLTGNKFPKDCNMSRASICFFRWTTHHYINLGGFSGVPSYDTNVLALQMAKSNLPKDVDKQRQRVPRRFNRGRP